MVCNAMNLIANNDQTRPLIYTMAQEAVQNWGELFNMYTFVWRKNTFLWSNSKNWGTQPPYPILPPMNIHDDKYDQETS